MRTRTDDPLTVVWMISRRVWLLYDRRFVAGPPGLVSHVATQCRSAARTISANENNRQRVFISASISHRAPADDRPDGEAAGDAAPTGFAASLLRSALAPRAEPRDRRCDPDIRHNADPLRWRLVRIKLADAAEQ